MCRRFVSVIAGFLAVLSICLSLGCESTRVWTTAFKDPAFSGRSFSNPAVYANTADLQWRHDLEKTLVAEMDKHGIPAKATFELIPPTRSLSPEERMQVLLEHGIDALVVIEFGESGVEHEYMPLTGTTTETSGTVSTYGNTGTYQGTSYTTVHGGYDISKPWAKMSTHVLDVASGRKAWVASSYTGGNAFASFEDIRNSYCKKILEQMLVDRVVVGSSPKQ